ncbi:GNAT family N-acetyltransferase [Pseudokineococcus basanitobsidens]|uniref:GNAT family N-acetyltransferase n=1 Tax=Pseudokineococcus basanitobsidens TaxID=1926649 RepID=A0ABU8RJ49_9ACTN
MRVDVRLVRLDDVPVLARLAVSERDVLAPYEPRRDEAFATEEGQRADVEAALAGHAAGTRWSGVVLLDGEVVGRTTVSDVVRGAFQSGHVGYWVSQQAGGRGVAGAAVAQVLGRAFGDMELHRLRAATLPNNVRSQKVLRRNGFDEIGYAPRYLRIAGRWQDHVLFQRLADG